VKPEQLRICFDLDGTICDLRKPGQTYCDVLPKQGAVEFLRKVREAGHYIILHTARGMGTAASNQGAMMKRVGQVTFDWLERHGIVYDEIYFGKPNAHVTVDDRSVRFESWDALSVEQLQALARPE
jgi:capsule biosynthesis phosphatase